MINILNAIERHTAALTTRPAARTEDNFLSGYRRHVIARHGELEPPDFDRRRRVPIAEIYVPDDHHRGPAARTDDRFPPGCPAQLDIYGLAGRLDRSVLLGDPGGGKTTAANVLMHHFAGDPQEARAFLVTLREYASGDSPQLSVVAHIERLLSSFYQIPPPAGLVESAAADRPGGGDLRRPR